MNLNLSKFKKISEDHESATLKHPAGHSIKIAKKGLSSKMKEELSGLPLHYEEGTKDAPVPDVSSSDDSASSEASGSQPIINIYNRDPGTAAEAVQSAGVPASMPKDEPAPEVSKPQAPDYFTNGTFDTNKFILESPQAPISSKLNVAQKLGAQEDASAQAQQQQQAKTYQQAMQYNQLAAQHGLPLIEMPAMPKMNAAPQPTRPAPMPASAPAAQPQMPMAGSDYIQTMNRGMDEQEQAIRQQMQAQSQLGQAQSRVYDQSIQQKQQMLQKTQEIENRVNEESMRAVNDYRNGHLDSNRVFHNMGTFDKIRTALGLIVGGMAGGMQHRENPAVTSINNAIERDINAQKYEIDKNKNLVSAYNGVFNNVHQAATMARIVNTEIVQDELNKEISKAQSPYAKAAGMKALGEFDMKKAELKKQLVLQQLMLGQINGAKGGDNQGNVLDYLRASGADPKVVEGMQERYVPGVGISSVKVPDKVRDEIISRQALDEAIADLRNFQQENEGTVMDRDKVNEGKAKAALVQDAYRRANNQGVFREAEKNFVAGIVDEDPTKFFGSWRVDPKYRALEEGNMRDLNAIKKGYGLPVRYQPTSAKPYEGKK